MCAAHACLDDQALLTAREAIGSNLQTPGSAYAVLLALVVSSMSTSADPRLRATVIHYDTIRTARTAGIRLAHALQPMSANASMRDLRQNSAAVANR